jgi:diphthamide synthase (EF-2-diphthine--ammonia ligase)
MPAPKAYVSWSSGKDSAMGLLVAKRSGIIDVAGILTTTSEAYERVAIHGVREQLLVRRAAALNLPLCNIRLPVPCSNERYEATIKDA